MTTREDTHGPNYFTPVFLSPQLCNSTSFSNFLPSIKPGANQMGDGKATVAVTGTVKARKADPGKGLTYLYRQDHPKTKRSFRIITVDEFTTETLRRLHLESEGNSYVFGTSAGTLRSPHNVRVALRKACGSDFEEQTPHTLRRTVATIVAAEQGIEVASLLLGHASIQITDRAYNRPLREVPDTSGTVSMFSSPRNGPAGLPDELQQSA